MRLHVHFAIVSCIRPRVEAVHIGVHTQGCTASTPSDAAMLGDMDQRVRESYGARADEYTARLGSVEQLSPLDRRRILEWAHGAHGPLLDLGCGPGHWTALLHDEARPVRGIDLVPEFVELARRRFPGIPFDVGDASALDADDDAYAGVLAWYSLIHTDPSELPARLSEIGRILSPGGRLLVGFFDGPDAEPFPHAVVDAFTWSIDGMSRLLRAAGFDVLDSERRADPGVRPHASITGELIRPVPQSEAYDPSLSERAASSSSAPRRRSPRASRKAARSPLKASRSSGSPEAA